MSNSAKVDQKGRLKIPVTLLTTLKGPGTEFYLTSEDGCSVRIYPKQVWNQVEEGLERLCSHNRNNQKLLVRAKYFGQAVTMDKQGRVLIPIVLRSSAQMKGAVDVLDYLNYLEVWNHARFLKNLKSNPITTHDEKTLNKLSSSPQSTWAVHRNTEEGHAHRTEGRFRINRRMRPDSRGDSVGAARTERAGRARMA
jgi:MraZ protein